MITKELFVKTLEEIRRERKRLDEFSAAIDKICVGYPIVTAGEGYLAALLGVLNALFDEENNPYPLIEWWLFENVEKKIWEKDRETEEAIEYDVSDPGRLYDYLVKNH